MNNKELAQEKAIIMNKIIRGVKGCNEKIVTVKYYSEDGRDLGTQHITLEDKLKLDKEYKLPRKVVQPFNYMSKNEELLEQYTKNLTTTEIGYITKLSWKVDLYGRIKYGKNRNQYCRTYEDLAKVLEVSYNTLRQNLLPKLKENDILRVVIIDKNIYKTMYISFNPILLVGGGYWDRWEVIIWYDVLLKHKLITMKEAKEITGLTEKEITEEKDRLTSLYKHKK